MTFDAVNFLGGLFTRDSVPSDIAPETIDVDDVGGGRHDLGVQGGEDTPAADPFAGWTLRPDVSGRLGYEAPNLPEAVRWWARSTWEELSTLDAIPGLQRPKRPGIDPCGWCGRRDWWRSVYGVVVCGGCYTPAVPELVVEWLNRSETARPEETTPGLPRGCVPGGSADR